MKHSQKNDMNDKEKLRMGKNLIKSNNKKIKTALKAIDDFEKSDPMTMFDIQRCLQTIKKIKEILES